MNEVCERCNRPEHATKVLGSCTLCSPEMMSRQDMVEAGWNMDIEFPDDEEDFLTGKTCNPDAPEECESCQ